MRRKGQRGKEKERRARARERGRATMRREARSQARAKVRGANVEEVIGARSPPKARARAREKEKERARVIGMRIGTERQGEVGVRLRALLPVREQGQGEGQREVG